MGAFLTALNAVLPVFILIGIGALLARCFKGLDISTLARVTLYAGIPAVVFQSIRKAEIPLNLTVSLTIGYLLYLLVLGGVTYLSTRDLPKVQSRSVVAAALFGNSGNMGLPIALFAYGQAGLERGMVLFVVSIIVMYIGSPMLLAGTRNVKENIKRTLMMPPIPAALLGILFNVLNWDVPVFMDRGVQLLADTALPLMLLTLGMQTYRSWIWTIDMVAVRTSILRFLGGGVITYLVCVLLGLRGLDLAVMMLGAMMPAAVTTFVVAVEVGGDVNVIVRTVVLSTVLSLGLITLSVMFFPA
ncbi:AEC family transporter [Deinococcus cellulosilyticus]|uniref:Transporter n=1 Tax=Deinococcus cellulosilyticus (strain DSM 18568 / NBRC 106333 / KACC 11606 / 5516J-15) TaxID=1223518 RepID=A0A511N7S2_DEIC1|nr:AEC family transporter [Deinococcus cellulosilyticus]GEM48884.1 transporter [Deinococcus cellulosilyticus NBRC 106333 = KACC 11606]